MQAPARAFSARSPRDGAAMAGVTEAGIDAALKSQAAEDGIN